MNAFTRISILVVLLTGLAGFSFAGTNQTGLNMVESHTVVDQPRSIVEVVVPVTAEVKAWFAQHNVDPKLLDLPAGKLTVAYKDAIDQLMENDDYRDLVRSLVNPVLQAKLKEGGVDKASMQFGRQLWSLALYSSEDYPS